MNLHQKKVMLLASTLPLLLALFYAFTLANTKPQEKNEHVNCTPERHVCVMKTIFNLEDEHMLSIKIGVSTPDTPTNRITLRQLDQLLMLLDREGRAGDSPALQGIPAQGVMHRCICAHCSAPFDAPTARATYCPGGRCRQAAYRARKAAQRRALATCAGCSERFKPTNGNQVFCCSNCRSRTWKRQRRAAAYRVASAA